MRKNFEVHNFVFLISNLVSMHNFTSEKVVISDKILHFKFHTFCPLSASQILNAVIFGHERNKLSIESITLSFL